VDIGSLGGHLGPHEPGEFACHRGDDDVLVGLAFGEVPVTATESLLRVLEVPRVDGHRA